MDFPSDIENMHAATYSSSVHISPASAVQQQKRATTTPVALQAAVDFATATRRFCVHVRVLCSAGSNHVHIFPSKAKPNTRPRSSFGRLIPGVHVRRSPSITSVRGPLNQVLIATPPGSKSSTSRRGTVPIDHIDHLHHLQ